MKQVSLETSWLLLCNSWTEAKRMISQFPNWKESCIQAWFMQLPARVQEKEMPEISLCSQPPTMHLMHHLQPLYTPWCCCLGSVCSPWWGRREAKIFLSSKSQMDICSTCMQGHIYFCFGIATDPGRWDRAGGKEQTNSEWTQNPCWMLIKEDS